MGLFKWKKPENEKKIAERRRYPRTVNCLKINYQIANETLRSDCRSKDISEGGIRFSLFQKLEVGTTLKLCIYLQDFAEPIWVIGRVAWTKETPGKEYPFEAGIEFNYLDFLDTSVHSKIKDHIQDISKEKK